MVIGFSKHLGSVSLFYRLVCSLTQSIPCLLRSPGISPSQSPVRSAEHSLVAPRAWSGNQVLQHFRDISSQLEGSSRRPGIFCKGFTKVKVAGKESLGPRGIQREPAHAFNMRSSSPDWSRILRCLSNKAPSSSSSDCQAAAFLELSPNFMLILPLPHLLPPMRWLGSKAAP